MSGREEQEEFLILQIKALQRENERLNDEIKKIKENVFKIELSNPNMVLVRKYLKILLLMMVQKKEKKRWQ